MKCLFKVATAFLLLLLLAPVVVAQEERGEFGVYADYTRFKMLNNQNFWGLGGRVAFNANRYLQLEGQMAYDFERSFVSTSPGFTASFQNTRFRILEGLFGPKIQSSAGPVKVFGTFKTGFTNFSITQRALGSGFTSSISQVPEGNTHFALYPGGGLELFKNWFGVRMEVGDMIFFENGAHNNLKVSFGPVVRW